MSLNYLFKNGLGPGAAGCRGQSPDSCNIDVSGCSNYGGPGMAAKLRGTTNVQFQPISIVQGVRMMQQIRPRVAKNNYVKTSRVPLNGVGIL